MQKVYITSYNKKGDLLFSAVGMHDTKAKVIYIPKVSKKGIAYFEEVEYKQLRTTKTGSYAIDDIIYIDDRAFVNTYFFRELNEKKGETK